MPCVVVYPVPMPVPRAMAMHPREALPGNPSQSVWDERALYIDIGTGIGRGHRHHSPAQMLQPSCEHGHGRCSAPQTLETDPFQAPRWASQQLYSQSGLQGPLLSMRCSQYAVSTVPCYSTNNARLLCPGINEVPTPHTTHTPPLLSKAAKHCHLHHTSLHPLMYSVPSTMLRGRGWRSGGLDFTMQSHGTVHITVSCRICVFTYCTAWARPKSPPFASDTTAATRITAWPRRQPHQGRERFRSSRWQYRDRALDHTRRR